jgi:hypothetical protein
MSKTVPSRAAAFGIACACLAGAATTPAQAAGKIEVNWVHPESYIDAGQSTSDRLRVMTALGQYLGKLGGELPDGQTLHLDVLDVDLAGELRPFGTQDVRVLRGRADWPQIRLRYTLVSSGATLKTGEAQIDDMGYMLGPDGEQQHWGELPYEKRMLHQWFEQNFRAPATP